MANARDELASLWNGEGRHLIVVQSDLDPAIVSGLDALQALVDGNHEVQSMEKQTALVNAQLNLEKAAAKPSLSLDGGYRRSAADGSHTLVFGIGLPLPFFNRNQGTRESLEAKLRSLDYQIERARLETSTAIKSNVSILRQLIYSHNALDSILLPKAEEAYETLQHAYEAGRVSYTQLLEAERSLNELRFEHNDMLLAIYKQIIALEGLTGITMRTDEE